MSVNTAISTTSENRFGDVFEQSPFSMQLLALDGTTIGVNQAWENLWLGKDGASLKALVLRGKYSVLTDPQLEAKGLTPYLRRAFNGETVNLPAIRYDPTELGVKGRPRWVTSRAAPIRDRNGVVAEVMLVHEDISDRIEAEQELRASEERFRSRVEAISQIVWTCDANGHLVEDSPSWSRFTGQSPAQLRGAGWLDAVHPDDRAGAAAAWAVCLANASLYQTEYRLRRADGTWRNVEARAVPLTGPDGRVREWVGINTDVTEHRRAEQAVQNSEQRMRRIFDTMQQKIFTATAAGEVDYANHAWDAFTGLPHAAMLGWSWTEFMHPDDVAPSKLAWTASLETGAALEVEQRFRRRDGAWRWHLTRAVPMRADDGAILMWVGANTDIHEVKSAEAELARRLATERRHFAILSKVAAASHTLHTATSVDAMAHQLVEMVRDILEVQRAVIALQPADASAQPINAVSMSETCMQHERGGAELAVPLLAVPLLAHDGSRIGLLKASHRRQGSFTEEDAAILKQLASIAATGFENARLYATLQDQHRRKDEFLAMLAHELRNPLAPIRTAADLLAVAPPDTRQISQLSGVISRQASHMAALVDDLLDVSRVTRGLISLASEALDVSRLVRDAIEQAQPLIEARRHTLTVIMSPEPVQTRGDYKRLIQVLCNLLNNAARYTAPGGAIQIRVEAAPDTVRFVIADNGAGIAPELQSCVFELFSQATRNPDRAQGGLGIGLALVKNLVALHGGDVACSSAGIGHGSTFTVSLPRLSGPAVQAQQESAAGVPSQAARLRVLLVDDNVDAAETLGAYLDAVGHEVVVEHDGASALARLESGAFDACILDIGLPGMDGHALARQVRALPAMAQAVLIAVTGYGSESDKANSAAAGFDHHLVKPVDVRLLPALLERAAVAPAAARVV